ncbi:transporter substrate-binding domain-containing protein [Aestuariirhabdus sp. Z084]|uniref:substrate-binding periplasmic protein n=1 Tax=Aestuariirhabdus haliotis TaxID=2918751 RepID=UPI00201B382B|nr:transporter substrate-binding domain-containing protein [Aestuariirhabdus haliotis]MCL6416983.1 transporter substrate-binding domain-containing protein [Aestuariirhabdus haliotis]MCL6421010.1 transporter substrate-binding domain-containing protein [Aestuariirhabdus haliotis]
MLTRFYTSCLLACLILVPASLQAASLRIGTTAQYPPFTSQHQGELRGLEIELAQRLGQSLGRSVEFRIMSFAELIPALSNNSVDLIMSGMSVTAEREQRVLFTQPITHTGQVAIIHQRNIALLGEPWQLKRSGRRIGVKHGTTGEQLVAEQYPEAIVMSFNSIDQALAVLAAGEIDYVIHDAQTSWLITQNREFNELISLNQPLTKESIAWAVNPRAVSLQQELNRFIAELKRSGELDQLVRKWLPLTVRVNQ